MRSNGYATMALHPVTGDGSDWLVAKRKTKGYPPCCFNPTDVVTTFRAKYFLSPRLEAGNGALFRAAGGSCAAMYGMLHFQPRCLAVALEERFSRVLENAMAEPSLELLMQMVQKVLDSQREVREDVREIKTRLGRLETDVAQLHVFLAEQSIRLDRFSDRLERVERRLDIVGT